MVLDVLRPRAGQAGIRVSPLALSRPLHPGPPRLLEREAAGMSRDEAFAETYRECERSDSECRDTAAHGPDDQADVIRDQERAVRTGIRGPWECAVGALARVMS